MQSLRVLVVVIGALVLGACQSGPSAVGDGSYRAFAVAGGGTPPAVTMEIQESSVLIAEDGTVVELTIGAALGDYTLCPPRGDGALMPLNGSIDLGTIQFDNPAIFGDCGETSPERVTLVDLDSNAEGALPPFVDWLEFCDVKDPDC